MFYKKRFWKKQPATLSVALRALSTLCILSLLLSFSFCTHSAHAGPPASHSNPRDELLEVLRAPASSQIPALRPALVPESLLQQPEASTAPLFLMLGVGGAAIALPPFSAISTALWRTPLRSVLWMSTTLTAVTASLPFWLPALQTSSLDPTWLSSSSSQDSQDLPDQLPGALPEKLRQAPISIHKDTIYQLFSPDQDPDPKYPIAPFPPKRYSQWFKELPFPLQSHSQWLKEMRFFLAEERSQEELLRAADEAMYCQ